VEIDARGEVSPAALSRTGVRQVRKMLEDHNLRVAAVSFRTRRGYAVEEDLEPRVAAAKAAMELAQSLGARVVVSPIGRVPSPDSGAWKLLIEVLGDLGRHGMRSGAALAAETGSESGEELARLLAALPEGSMGADLNPGRLVLNGFSTLDAVGALKRWILHVHLSDATCSAVPGLARPAGIGRGSVDFPSLLGALDEAGYQGYFTIQAQAGGDPLAEVSAALEYLRRL
jgi:sugar phosphate isomerase/epimerase